MLIKVCLLWWELFSSTPDKATVWTCYGYARGLSALQFLEIFQGTCPCYLFKMRPRIFSDLKAIQTVNLQVQTWGKRLSMPREQGSHQQCLGTVPTGLLPDVSKKVKWAGGRAWCAVSAPEPAIFRAARTQLKCSPGPQAPAFLGEGSMMLYFSNSSELCLLQWHNSAQSISQGSVQRFLYHVV